VEGTEGINGGVTRFNHERPLKVVDVWRTASYNLF